MLTSWSISVSQTHLVFLACAVGYKALQYPELREVNTQVVEQNNSKLRKLKSSLSYMKPENFMDTLKFFLWYCNYNSKRKNSKKQ